MSTVLITGATLIDGTGSPAVKADVFIKGDRIEAVGTFGSKSADTVIDGEGMIVAPGFIDVNTDSDHYLSLFTDPAQQDFLTQGVTTIIGGHCGSSLAPLIKGTLESIRKWGDINLVNVNWHTMEELLWTLQTVSPAINFATLVGHSTVRRGLIGDQIRDLTEPELQLMSSILRQAVEEGAIGISTGLAYNHSRETPYNELKMLASLVARFGAVYSTHLRNETEGLIDSITETIALAKEARIKTIISHFRPIKGFEKQFTEALEMINKVDAEIYFDAYPFDYSIVPIYTLLPDWAAQGSLEQMQAVIKDPLREEDLKKDFAKISGDDIIIARAPGFDYSIGKNITQYAAAQEVDMPQGLLNLMRFTRLKGVVFKRNINYSMIVDALMSDKALVASNSPSLLEGRNVIENERASKTFSKFLDICAERGVKLEWAINKITEKPAKIFGLKDRGIIREGAIADVVVLQKVSPDSEAHRVGLRAIHAIIAGELALKDGVVQATRNGKIIKRQ
jgi:N-acyl-D-amino-acid deacylase